MRPIGDPLQGHASNRRRLALREHTAAAHAALDARVGKLDTIEGYGSYLLGMYGFRQPLETALAEIALPGCLGGWRSRPLAPAIHADLADLGHAAVAAAPAALPRMGDPSSLLGVLYVLEGASLGARLLYRRARRLGMTERYGARHLALQAQGAVYWRRFLALLEDAPAFDPGDAADAALATFAFAHSAVAELR